MTERLPSSLVPDLRAERLRAVADLMVRVRDEAVSGFNLGLGDDSWSLGCQCYARTKNRLIKLAESTEWLSIVDASLEFVFKIGAIPIRFHRERDQQRRSVLCAQPLSAASQGTFAFVEAKDSHFRIVVIVGDDNRAQRVVLVRYAHLRVTEDSWSLFERDSSKTIRPLAAPPVDLPAPEVRVRHSQRKPDESAG